MAGPSKRRKKNDGTATSAGGGMRKLDFFFRKRSGGVGGDPEISQRTGHGDKDNKGKEDSRTEQMTDEELARKLHEEWNGVSDELEKEQGEKGEAVIKEKKVQMCAEAETGTVPEAQKAMLSSVIIKDKRLIEAKSNPILSTQSNRSPITGSVTLAPTLDADKTYSEIPLDQDPLTFDPDLYGSLIHSFPNAKATYALLTRGFVLVTSTRSRIKIIDTLVNLLRVIIRHDPASLLPAVWLATNSIGPSYENNELGLGGSILSKAILKVSGISKEALKALHNKHGDPGDVAFDAKVKQRTLGMKKMVPLTIYNVYDTLVKIANAKGQGSQKVKQRHVERLMVDAKGEEVRYLTRTLIQHLRIGAVKTTMLITLSRAFLLSAPPGSSFFTYAGAELAAMGKEARVEVYSRAEEIVKQCFARRPNYNDIVPVLLEGGLEALKERVRLELHIPLRPMLGSITRDLGEMLVKLEGREFPCEYKYDGQRAQVHCDETGKVSIFSRHLELMTDKYPDLVALVQQIRGDGVRSFIMEGEVVAVDSSTGSLRTFQALAGRARKDVAIGAVSVNVCMFAFDLMYLNGEQLLSRSFRKRRELLRSMFTEIQNQFTWVKSLDATSQDHEAILEFFKSALDIKCEGIMVKVLDNQVQEGVAIHPDGEFIGENEAVKKDYDKEKGKGGRRKPLLSTYEPDKRLESWLKVKKDYDAAADSLDLVPIAGWHGSGRKAKWWSPILLAVHNPETGSFEPVCKCMSGFTDAFYTSLKERYNKDAGFNTSATRPTFYEPVEGLEPDVWFEAQEVWEVKFGDITLSPTYPAARGLAHEDRGLSLRFPRFIRVRDDKGIEEASSAGFLAELFEKQMAIVEKEKKLGGIVAEGIEEGEEEE